MDNIFIEKSLKRYIKSKKIGYTASLLVGFLITGNIIYGESIYISKSEVEKKIEENKKRIKEIEKRTVELLKEGDYYVKTLENNKQFFFPLEYEHRHASKGNKYTETIPGIPIIPPGEDGGPTETIPGIPIIPPGENGGPTETIPGMPLNPSVTRPEKPNVIKPEILTPVLPYLPEKSEVNSELEHIDIGNIEEPQITPSTPDINTDIVTPHIGKIEIDDSMEQGVGKIDIDKYIDISGNADTNINITEAGFNPKRPDVSYVYVPKEPISPEKFTIDEITAPSDIHLPDIKVNTSSFVQGNGGIGGNGAHSGFFAENYGTYEATGKDGITLTFRDEYVTYGVGNYLDYEDKDIFANLKITTVDKVNQEGNKHYTNQEVKLEDIKKHNPNRPRHEYIAELNKPGLNVNVASLISTTMDRDSKILGKYNIIYDSGVANYNNSRIFLSVNNAGILWKGDRDYGGNNRGNGSYNQIGTANNNGDAVDDKNGDKQEKMAVLTEFTGELNLKNEIKDGKAYGTLIGIDHQLWDAQFDIPEKDSNETSTEYLQSYSIAKNSGTINLGDANTDTRHRSLMGISIISERDNVTDRKLHNHVTLNAGTININSENSIGIGFEDGKSLAEDLYVGNVIFNGNKSDSSYGLRLKNSVDHTDNKNQFDGVRVFGSVADNINLGKTQNDEDQNIDDKIKDNDGIKKISVDGHNNGGVVIAKSLSAEAQKYLKNADSKDKYTGMFNDDIKVSAGQNGEKVFEGYDKGKVLTH